MYRFTSVFRFACRPSGNPVKCCVAKGRIGGGGSFLKSRSHCHEELGLRSRILANGILSWSQAFCVGVAFALSTGRTGQQALSYTVFEQAHSTAALNGTSIWIHRGSGLHYSPCGPEPPRRPALENRSGKGSLCFLRSCPQCARHHHSHFTGQREAPGNRHAQVFLQGGDLEILVTVGMVK